MIRPQKPYGVGIEVDGGICIFREYQTLGAAIDGMIRMQAYNESKLQVFKHVEGDTWKGAVHLNQALKALESVVKA